MIPKIIHQTAMADKSKWHPSWEKFQNSWKEKFPDFEYKIWTDEDLEDLIRAKNESFYESYRQYDINIKRVDSARYFILHEFGGIYADMDYECTNNFYGVLPDDKISFAESGGISVSRLENALMASPKGHQFWDFLFPKLEESKHKGVFEATGPIFLDRCIKEYPDGDFVNFLNRNEFSLLGGKYAVHHQTGVWTIPKKTQIDSVAYEMGTSNYEISVSPNIYPDAFYISAFENQIIVKRKDQDMGWGQNLNLVVRNKCSGKEYVVKVGPSESSFKIVSHIF